MTIHPIFYYPLKEKEESAMALLKEGVSPEKVAKCLKLKKKRVEELKQAI